MAAVKFSKLHNLPKREMGVHQDQLICSRHIKKPCHSKIRRPSTDAEETKPEAKLLMSQLVRANEVQAIEEGFFLLEK